MILQKAERKNVKIKLALQGPSGSGKTFSALQIAYGLTGNWNKIAVIDTENHSSELYSHLGEYFVLSLEEPFAPEKYRDAIEVCEREGIEVIIMDSISHEWDGSGGILDIHGNMTGNSFTNWAKVIPRHNDFVNAILQSNCHIIATLRTKQDYVLSDKNGKMVPEKVGLKGISRDGIDYEFTVVFDLDIKHVATSNKDRTGLFMDKITHILTEADGKKIKYWCESGLTEKQVLNEINSSTTVEELKNVYLKYPDFQKKLNELFTNKKSELQKTLVDLSHPNFTSNGRVS